MPFEIDPIWTFLKEAPAPPTVGEVASALGISTSTARRRLKKLREMGRAESLKDGRITTWRALNITKRLPASKYEHPGTARPFANPPDWNRHVLGQYNKAPEPAIIELFGFDPFEVPADGKWQVFASFHSGREAERTRYRIASLGWTPPGKGSKQVEVKIKTSRGWPRRTVYQVRVRAMPARKPPSKARA